MSKTIVDGKRKRIGVVIDYTLRFPDFVSCYNQMKKEILEGEMTPETDVINLKLNYFKDLSKLSREAYDFYLKTPTPEYSKDFDYTFRKYFFLKEDLNNFLETWSFNLFAQMDSLKKMNTEFVNICQNKLCDVILIDRIVDSRKIPNTLSFLSKARLYFRGLEFVESEAKMKRLKSELFDVFDPLEQFKDQKIDYLLENNKLLNWLKELEGKLQKAEKNEIKNW